MTGKEFEQLLLWRAAYDEEAGKYMLNRYGVMSCFIKGVWTPVPSYPDFDMVINGHQCVFDAKVCSQASYNLSGGTSKSWIHQYKFLKRKARAGAYCFMLLHFNARQLKTKLDEAATYILPIPSPLWDRYETGELKAISRTNAKDHGISVPWSLPTTRCTKLAPDLYIVLKEVLKKNE